MTNETEIDSRLAQIEIKLNDTEDTVDILNKAIFRQQQQIELLTREIVALRRQASNSNPSEALSLRDELPPHY